MNGAVLKLVVDNTQHNSQKADTFLLKQHNIFDGKAEVVRTKTSGGIWHFRMWVTEEKKYVRKTLKTKNLDTAIAKAEDEYHLIKSNLQQGKTIFSPTIISAVELYLEHRQKDVDRGYITQGRHTSLKSSLKHFVAYVGIIGVEGMSRKMRLSDLDKKCLYGYQKYRQSVSKAQDVTIRNELSTINAMCEFLFDEGLHNVAKWKYPPITTRGVDIDLLRRATYTDEEYKRITKALITYTSQKQAKAEKIDADALFTRQSVRHYFLILANTMLRVGEARQLKWSDVKTFDENGQRLAEISVRAETSKVRKSRIIVVRGGEHFDRLKMLTKDYFAKNDLVEDFDIKNSFVFVNCEGKKQTAETLYWHYAVFMALAEVNDWKERNLTYYSCRHFGITKRLQSNVNPLTLSKTCGTSLKHITETYYHADLGEQVKGATAQYKRSEQ